MSSCHSRSASFSSRGRDLRGRMHRLRHPEFAGSSRAAIIHPSARIFSNAGSCRSRVLADGTGRTRNARYEIENQAKPLEAVAHSVKTQIQQLVRRSQKPDWSTLKRGETCPVPCGIHIEVEGVGFSTLWCNSRLIPLRLQAGGNHRAAIRGKTKFCKQLFRSGEIRLAHEKVEVTAGAQRRVTINRSARQGPLSEITGTPHDESRPGCASAFQSTQMRRVEPGDEFHPAFSADPA